MIINQAIMKIYLIVTRTSSVLIPVFKKSIGLILSFVLLLSMQNLHAQEWLEKVDQPGANFYDIQKKFYETYYKKREAQRKPGDKVEAVEKHDGEYRKFKRWEWFMEPRVYPAGDITLPSKAYDEFQNYLRTNPNVNSRGTGPNTPARFLAANWTNLGPATLPVFGNVGRVNFIRFHPTNTNIMWVGAPSGGLWKSTNGGTSWTTNTDLLPMIGCSDLAIDPANTNIMYLATGDAVYTSANSIGILKSTDGGVNWVPTGLVWQLNLVRKIYRLMMDPSNSNTLLAATNDGVYKTTNAGTTWTRTQTGNISDIKFKPGSPLIVYAVSKFNSTFYKSIDGGTSFTSTATGLPVSSTINRYAIGVTPANVNYIYLLAVNTSNVYGGLYRSTNSGGSFAVRSTEPDIVSGQGYYNLALTVSPSNANDVYAGGIDHWRSTNGGTDWSAMAYNSHPDVHMMEFLPGSSTTIFTCNDGGIFKSTNNGGNWIDLTGGIGIGQMYRLGGSAANPGTILTGFQDNGTFKCVGGVWNNIMGGDGMECIVDYADPNIWYGSGANGYILKSTNAGTTWVPIVNNGGVGVHAVSSWVTPYIMHPTDHNTMLVGKRHVYRTVDGGVNWTQLDIPGTDPYMRTLAYAPSNPNYIYAGFSYNFYSCTDGNNFVNRNAGLPVSTIAITYTTVSNTNPNKVWVTFSGYSAGQKVYTSDDAGVIWTNYSTGLPNLPVNCITYQNGSNDILYVGTDVGVYYRDNTMASWQPYMDGLPNVFVSELEINYATSKLRAATYGRGLWEANLLPQAPICTPPFNTWLGTISTAWETAGNWSCGTVPDANTDVIINSGTVVLSSNVTIKSFNIKPGVNFTVNSGFNLNVNQ
jgi:photosystem II stability/assembly factor-like uncharacterized protein